jgi:hypothetical protein
MLRTTKDFFDLLPESKDWYKYKVIYIKKMGELPRGMGVLFRFEDEMMCSRALYLQFFLAIDICKTTYKYSIMNNIKKMGEVETYLIGPLQD